MRCRSTATPFLLKITARLAYFLLLYIILPVYITRGSSSANFKLLFFFYAVNALAIFFLLKRNSNLSYQVQYQAQSLEEKSNILNEENRREFKNQSALQAKIARYSSLKDIIEELNRNLVLDSVAESLVSTAFSVISNNKGVCILYLINKQLNLQILKTRKEDKRLVIKAKEGDIFDLWVLRHASPLLIEDAKKDFRFDLEKLKKLDLRPVLSLINSPLMSEHRFFGTLRLDSSQTGCFLQDDLRFLVKICDLGAAALENSELFQRAQNLAIHDSLTALYTKGYFLERLKEECKKSIRQRSVFSLLMLDIDFFKDYNDKFGHTAGDIVLKSLSRGIVEFLKQPNPTVSRFGGEEFCVILENTDKQKAYNLAGALREKIEKNKILLRRQETNITVSIGVAAFPLDAADGEDLIKKADMAMYEAKQKGRNQVCCA
ncbi:MAG: sensor domain-containing diguanylate cyclase [Candidatus Omnitrophota bacterium]